MAGRCQGVCWLFPPAVFPAHTCRPRSGRGADQELGARGAALCPAGSGAQLRVGHIPLRTHHQGLPPAPAACSPLGATKTVLQAWPLPWGGLAIRTPACSFGQKPELSCEEAGILTFRTRWEELSQRGTFWDGYDFSTHTHMHAAAGVGWGENGAGEAGSTPKLES